MLKVYGRVNGIAGVYRKLNRIKNLVSDIGLENVMRRLGSIIRTNYLAKVPIDTGLSKRSIRFSIKKKGPRSVMLFVGPSRRGAANHQNKRSFDYLHFPDHGTRHIRAQQFTRKTLRGSRTEIKLYLDNLLRLLSRVP